MEHGLLKKLICLPLLIVCCLCVAAQQDSLHIIHTTRDKTTFAVIVNAGLVAGASDRDLQVQTIAGLQHKSWFYGIGIAIDYYYLRGVPVFASVRKLFQKSMPLFLYADAGWSFPWIKKEESSFTGYTNEYKKGIYYDAGFGWHFKISKRNAFLLSAGYSRKTIIENAIPNWYPHNVTKVTYDLRRISLKAGFQ